MDFEHYGCLEETGRMADHTCRRSWRPAGWLVLMLLVGGGCHRQEEGDHATPAEKAVLPAIEAEVMTVESALLPATVQAQGSLVADEVTIVGAKVAGRVADLHVDVGDEVAQGDPLVTLDRAEFELQISLAEAQLAQARAALGLGPEDPLEQLVPQNAPPVREARAVWDEAKARTARLQQLIPKKAATREDLDAALAAERVAEARHASAINGVLEKIAQIRVRSAELALAQQQFDDAVVAAPFAGQIQERHVAHGSFVQLGQSVVTLVRTSTLRFRGAMPERHAQRLALGQDVKLAIESVAEPITAKITRLSPVVEERNRSLMFEVQLSNAEGRLRTGLFAEAEVIVDPQARAIVIPSSSLVEFAGVEKVWKVVDGVAGEQVVQTARRTQDGIEIAGGLAAGDVILRNASQGRAARITPPAASAASKEPSTPPDAPTLSVTETSSNDQ